MDLLHKLSAFALGRLSADRFTSLRARYAGVRRLAAPAVKLAYGTFDSAQLRAHLEQQLPGEFDVLMVHSSMNKMVPNYTGNPLELVRMLIDFCGPERTLAMPAFFFGDPAIGTVRETFSQNPRFDLRRTPSQMGLATELFRRSKGVIQSRHPVYRGAALGPLAQRLTQGHETASGPAGLGSPFDFMANHCNTVGLGIGKSYHVFTQIHHVEGALGDEFPVPRKPASDQGDIIVTVVDRDEEIQVRLPSSSMLWKFNTAKLPGLLQSGDMKHWKFHNVPMFCADAAAVTRSLIAAAKRGETLYDPV